MKKANNPIKKIYKQPPIVPASPTPAPLDPEIASIIGTNVESLNEKQRQALTQFMDVYANIDKNPFAVSMLQAHNYCIPNNQYFAQYNASQGVAQIAKNNNNEDEYIKLLKELLHGVITPLNNVVDGVHSNTAISYRNPEFESYFMRTMQQLEQHKLFVKCNPELDQLLDNFKKNKNHVIWPADEIPVLLNPHSVSTIEISRTAHSRQLVELLWKTMTDAEYANDLIRSTRCCMSGSSCRAITICCEYNLFATTRMAPVRMFRMRPYEMIAKNTWVGNNPYTTCYFCVSYFFWKQVAEANTKGSLASMSCSLPFVKEGFDGASFPPSMCVNKESKISKNIAYLSGSILNAMFYSYIYFDEASSGFRYIDDRFPKH